MQFKPETLQATLRLRASEHNREQVELENPSFWSAHAARSRRPGLCPSGPDNPHGFSATAAAAPQQRGRASRRPAWFWMLASSVDRSAVPTSMSILRAGRVSRQPGRPTWSPPPLRLDLKLQLPFLVCTMCRPQRSPATCQSTSPFVWLIFAARYPRPVGEACEGVWGQRAARAPYPTCCACINRSPG